MAAGTESQRHSSRSAALGIRFLLLCGLSITLLIVDQRENHLDAARRALSATVYPLRVIVDAPLAIWNWADETTTNRTDLLLETDRLNAERLLTNARLQRYAALEAENARLRAMLDATTRVRDQIRVAEILSVSPNPFRHSVIIDKGSRHDVYDGQTIVDSNGVVGQIIQVGLMSSQALLISDPDHALPVEVNRTGLRTIAMGTGEFDRLDLPFLANNADIREGDLLVTSGLGGAFPAGYPVAVVDKVTLIPSESFADVSARPQAALNQIKEIMLVWSTRDDANGEITDE